MKTRVFKVKTMGVENGLLENARAPGPFGFVLAVFLVKLAGDPNVAGFHGRRRSIES